MGCELKGKVAVISGGTSGIGLAAAQRLVIEGAQVILLGRNPERGKAAVSKLKPDGKGNFIAGDISTLDGCLQAGEKVRSLVTHVDILINAAGLYREKRLSAVTGADYDEVFNLNVRGTIFLTQAMLPLMTQRGAAIINIASDAGVVGNYGCPLYCASKGAVVAFTKALALDCAPEIRVNCLCPGDVATPLWDEQVAQGGSTEEEAAVFYPLGRIGRPEEIAYLICAVASPLNGFMTGAIIRADGGYTAK